MVTGLEHQGDFATAYSEQTHQFGQSQNNIQTELLVLMVKVSNTCLQPTGHWFKV